MFCRYQNSIASAGHRRCRKPVKQTYPCAAKYLDQKLGHLSLIWPSPPWPGIAAENTTNYAWNQLYARGRADEARRLVEVASAVAPHFTRARCWLSVMTDWPKAPDLRYLILPVKPPGLKPDEIEPRVWCSLFWCSA